MIAPDKPKITFKVWNEKPIMEVKNYPWKKISMHFFFGQYDKRPFAVAMQENPMIAAHVFLEGSDAEEFIGALVENRRVLLFVTRNFGSEVREVDYLEQDLSNDINFIIFANEAKKRYASLSVRDCGKL